jgi:exopolysaccharide biosynthesis glucuronosyltransferase PssE
VIFVTVGAQMPFDRLVRTVDEWALRRGRDDAFAQIGPTDWRPRHIPFTQFLDQREFREKVREASVVVAHAGMGSILTARELAKPILVMPRRGDLQETRNDHQVATAKIFREFGWVSVAFDERELESRLDELSSMKSSGAISSRASDRLIASLKSFIESDALPIPHTAARRRAQ